MLLFFVLLLMVLFVVSNMLKVKGSFKKHPELIKQYVKTLNVPNLQSLINMVTTVYTQLVNELPLILRDKLKQIKLIYLFGSQVTGFTSKTSDIDIAVLTEKKLDSVLRWHVEAELADELSSEVDLVDLLSASTVMQNEIIHHGICIYDPENKAALFETQVMSMYQHLNDERAAILKQHMS